MPAGAERDADIVVIGGGPTGLSAALGCAEAGYAVRLIAPSPETSDQRTSALMVSTLSFLERLGVWPDCAGAAAPLRKMRIIDDTGRLLRARTVEFDAEEIGEEAFGWNIPNAALTARLHQRVTERPDIVWSDDRVSSVALRDAGVTVSMESGRSVRARLVVGADGHRSKARAAARITIRKWPLDQAAIALNLDHDREHDFASTEFHRRPGPFTLVPLPGRRSSLVWVETKERAEALRTADDATLAREIERLSHRILGRVTVDGPRGMFPLGGAVAREFARNRIALVGEAAHVMPPIGAQGLNLGLRDVAALLEAIGAAGAGDPGSAAVLSRYDRGRRTDVWTRVGGVELLNRSLLAGFVPVQAARALGLSMLGSVGPLRRTLMREGVSPHLALPALMRPRAEDTPEPPGVP